MTEREKVLLQREAAATALERLTFWKADVASVHACKLFPMPKVTRPRVVQAATCEYRVVDGKVQMRGPGDIVWRLCQFTADDLRALGSLPDRPTEEVEDEDE